MDARYYGGIAQLGEHLPCKQGVKGSNPFISIADLTKLTGFDKIRRRRKASSYLENYILRNI